MRRMMLLVHDLIFAIIPCVAATLASAESQNAPGSARLIPMVEIPAEMADEIAPKESRQQSGEIVGLRYRGLPPKKVESAFMASIEQNYIVSGRITEGGLRKLLRSAT